MKTFAEQFPSLAGETWSYAEIKQQVRIDEDTTFADPMDMICHWRFVEEHNVAEHCLDKQRVKEIISRLTLTGYRGNPEGYIEAKELLRELEL